MRQIKNILATVGLLAVIGIILFVWQLLAAANIAEGISQAADRITGVTVATFEAIDNSVNFVNPIPEATQEQPPNVLQSPTVAANEPAATPTAYFAPATPTAQFSPQFLADCALAQSSGRRSHPRCPTNAAEMLGQGR